jgi:hypothetical protein
MMMMMIMRMTALICIRAGGMGKGPLGGLLGGRGKGFVLPAPTTREPTPFPTAAPTGSVHIKILHLRGSIE